jgi:hypothetical protein
MPPFWYEKHKPCCALLCATINNKTRNKTEENFIRFKFIATITQFITIYCYFRNKLFSTGYKNKPNSNSIVSNF